MALCVRWPHIQDASHETSATSTYTSSPLSGGLGLRKMVIVVAVISPWTSVGSGGGTGADTHKKKTANKQTNKY